MNGSIQNPESPTLQNRLASLDILRGFDMFWIIGGGWLLGALIKYLQWPVFEPVAGQLEHAEWAGFRAWDLIFPLFIFISGAAMPFSFEKYLRAHQKSHLYFKIVRRAVVLILLGWVYNGLLRTLDFANLRYLSVLGLIGLAYLWASLIVINFKPAKQAIWAAAILLGYWILMTLVPVPGHGAGVLTKEGNVASYIDRLVVPGKLLEGTTDPEGLLMTLPACVLALAGALAGTLIKKQDVGKYRKCLWIAAAGAACLCVGLIWGRYFPMIKKLWTSSFVVYASGWSLLLLSLFYLVIDLWGLRKAFLPFMLIGVNPITIYLFARIIDFRHTAKFLFGGMIRIAGEPLEPVVFAASVLICELLFLFILYRKKIFLKV